MPASDSQSRVENIRNRSPRPRLAMSLTFGFILLLVGVGVGWAGATVFAPAVGVLDATKFTYVEVVTDEVGSNMILNTIAEWKTQPLGANRASGIVTTVNIEPGQEVGPGAILFTVGLRPVTVAQGSIPAFQTMSRGVSGADVAQLQSLLQQLGFYQYDVDGDFDGATRIAVEAWQESIGVEPDGVVREGDVVFVPSLPARVSLDPLLVRPGALLAGGESVVFGLSEDPVFTVPVTLAQASHIPIGTRVVIQSSDGAWEGFVSEQQPDDQNGITLRLAGEKGASVCGDSCETVPLTGQSFFTSTVIVVEPTSGLVVPSAALLSNADGSLAVIDDKDIEHPVDLIASAKGMSVIEGIRSGLRVRVPASEN